MNRNFLILLKAILPLSNTDSEKMTMTHKLVLRYWTESDLSDLFPEPVPSAGLPEADRGRMIQATGGKLAFRNPENRPGRPRQRPY